MNKPVRKHPDILSHRHLLTEVNCSVSLFLENGMYIRYQSIFYGFIEQVFRFGISVKQIIVTNHCFYLFYARIHSFGAPCVNAAFEFQFDDTGFYFHYGVYFFPAYLPFLCGQNNGDAFVIAPHLPQHLQFALAFVYAFGVLFFLLMFSFSLVFLFLTIIEVFD